jgi:hypothetical protein
MAQTAIQDAATWEDVNGVLLMEADCVPVSADWLDLLITLKTIPCLLGDRDRSR